MKLYYYTRDNGDGSASVKWCKEEHLQSLLDLFEDDPETYGANEGEPSYMTLPDGFDIESLGLGKYAFYNPQ